MTKADQAVKDHDVVAMYARLDAADERKKQEQELFDLFFGKDDADVIK